MTQTDERILTLNGGSSSIKFAVFSVDEKNALCRSLKGGIEQIGTTKTIFHAKGAKSSDDISRALPNADHAAVVAELTEWLGGRRGTDRLTAIGHRIVHGGPKYSKPQLITAEIVEELRRLSPIDPEHLPEEMALAQAFQIRFPELPQIACFDTAFHHDLPRVAQMLAIPRRYESLGVRRYGFHGLSYTFLMDEIGRLAGKEASKGRVVLAHLGSGASLAAVRDGKPVDTSMSFTPTAGLPMATRSGDLDPGLFSYLAQIDNLDADSFNKMVSTRSGLLGMSETSSDMRDLLDQEKQDARAAEAVALFCYQVRKWIGAFAAALGGLDMLVFAGGIGENSSVVRSRICTGLGFLGVHIDENHNSASASIISSPAARVDVRVIRTDEERVIAQMVCAVLGRSEIKRADQ